MFRCSSDVSVEFAAIVSVSVIPGDYHCLHVKTLFQDLCDVSLFICRFHAFLLFVGHPIYAVREVSIHRFSKILSEFALEYRTTRERVLQQKQKRANHRERNKTRGKMITDVSALHLQRVTQTL